MLADLIQSLTWRQIVLASVALVAFLAVMTFLSDPMLWRRYVGVVMNGADISSSGLKPTETVGGPVVYDLPHADQATRSVSEEALRNAEAFAAKVDSRALVVVHKGIVQTEWYADGWDRNRPLSSQAMHESLVALLVGAAIGDGAIASIDDPIGTYLTDWGGDRRGEITIRQLMIMSSGLQRRSDSTNPFSNNFRWIFASKTTPYLLRTQLDGKPGESFSHNSINSELLGLVLEHATGKRYADYLNEKLWQPLGNMPARVWLDHRGGRAHTSCCLMATAMDWARIGLMLANEGAIFGNRLVAENWVEDMTAPSPLNARYGYQIWRAAPADAQTETQTEGEFRQSEPFLAADTVYAAGRGGQRLYVVPSEALVIVRLGSADANAEGDAAWDNAYLVNTLIRGLTTRTARISAARSP